MKTLVRTEDPIVAATREKTTGRNDQRAVSTDSHLEIVTFQGIRKLPT
jgi:hypothetical protein